MVNKMNRITNRISLEMAIEIIEKAKKDGDSPVAITIMGPNLQPIVILAMDEVMPISVELSRKKAYTALITNTDTIFWEKEGVSKVNFADPNVSFFPGGILIKGLSGHIYGAIGVSGRKGRKEENEEGPPQDHELALIAKDFLLKNLEG